MRRFFWIIIENRTKIWKRINHKIEKDDIRILCSIFTLKMVGPCAEISLLNYEVSYFSFNVYHHFHYPGYKKALLRLKQGKLSYNFVAWLGTDRDFTFYIVVDNYGIFTIPAYFTFGPAWRCFPLLKLGISEII